MQDEYGALDSTGEVYTAHNFELESGELLLVAEVQRLLHIMHQRLHKIRPVDCCMMRLEYDCTNSVAVVVIRL